MTTIKSTSGTNATIELTPSYKIPLGLIVTALPLLTFLPWLSLVCALFGVFLTIQTVTIRLQFTAIALDVYRSGNLIRSFPYQDWLNWEIFWNRVPILFYFKEVKSIHFLPIIFDPNTLKQCLEQHCPKTATSDSNT